MIRVLLADDEPLIVKGLRKLIDWEALGMEIAGQAGDGAELLEQLDSCRPDLIVSDISMPHLSGIDIIKHINERGLPIKVVFISAFQEFGYARDAVAFGALDYLVKPLRKPQLEQVLHKAAQLINQQHEEERRRGKLRHLERKVRQEEIAGWLSQLAEGALPLQSEHYRLLCAELQGPLFAVGVIEVELAGGRHQWSEKETRLVEFAVGNILQEVMAASGCGQVFKHDGRLVYVCCHQSSGEPIQLAGDIHGKIRTFVKLGSTIGVSRTTNSLAGLSEAYRQAQKALAAGFFAGPDQVIEYEEGTASRPLEDVYALQQQLAAAFTANDKAAAAEAMNKLLEAVGIAAGGSRALAVSTCFSSLLYLVQELDKTGLLPAGGSLSRQTLQSRLDNCPTFARLREEMVRTAEGLFESIDAESGNKEKLLMAKIKQYIEEHYSEEVTLESAAGVIYMNPSYFSFFFKKHTGQNFKQYVTEIRMKHAVRLLLHTDLMVYEIAEKAGYNNARHFSDIFRKTFGQLPNDYRQSKKK